MDLTYNQFQVVRGLFDKPGATQREIAETARLGLATVNAAYKECVADGLIDEGRLTAKGMAELRPYAVDNAVILAAGLSSRFAPISYERPKGLLRVRGEILIERQIEQLKAAGVSDIVVVVGYRKEAFFYLEDKYGVRIVINRDYAERNNSSSIMLVREILGNTYICSSDNYFEVNPFESHVWKAYYSAQFFEGPTDEWCMETGAHGRITKVEIGGSDAWGMIGHAYFDREFSSRFRKILETEYDLPETRGKLWEHLYIDHIRELDMRIRRYDPPVIHEFDSLDELQDFDSLFLENVSSEIFDNIVAVLDCKKSEIRDVWPIKQGMTNLSCHFATDDGEYVYRHPGTGSDEITNRRAEVEFQKIARKLDIDGTYVHEDPDEGWKISRYVDGARTLDYHDWDEVGRAMTMLRKLHDSGADCGFSKDMHEDTLMQLKLLDDSRRTQFGDFAELFRLADGLNTAAMARGARTVPCHNDFYDQNFLITENEMHLIDWEFAGMSDYASDLAVFIACCPDYTYEDALRVFELYFGRTPTDEELFHCVAYTAVISFHWFIWALYKDVCGEPVGEFLYYYYRYTKLFGKKAVELNGGEL